MLLCEHVMSGGEFRVSLGEQHSVILKEDGSVWSTAIKLRGLVSANDLSTYFTRVIPEDAKAVSAGSAYTLVMKQDDSVWAMGRNYKGQLVGTRERKDTFLSVQTIVGAKTVIAGGIHSMLLTHHDHVWATGWNKYGQLGDGLATSYRCRF